MIGRTNAGAGIKKLAMAKAEKSAPLGDEFYVTLTCDFDPQVIYTGGPIFGNKTGRSELKWRLTKNDAWANNLGTNVSYDFITVSGRTITAGPFEEDTTGPIYSGYVFAYGFPD